MAFEAIADDADEIYDFSLTGYEPVQVDRRPMIRQLVDDIQRDETAGRISASPHKTLAWVVGGFGALLRDGTSFDRICLSGGRFQDLRSLRGSLQILHSNALRRFFQRQVPGNDCAIALGQAAIARELLQRRF